MNTLTDGQIVEGLQYCVSVLNNCLKKLPAQTDWSALPQSVEMQYYGPFTLVDPETGCEEDEITIAIRFNFQDISRTFTWTSWDAALDLEDKRE